MAVYEFFIDRKIPPVTPHDKSLMVEFEALAKVSSLGNFVGSNSC